MTTPLHIACPACDAVNRVPAERLAQAPGCGACGRKLFDAHPVALDDPARFARHAQKSDIPLLVDFWAAWCGPCRMMAPVFEAAAAQLEPHFRLAKLDTEAAPAIAAQFGIRSIPSLVMLRQGREIARVAGAMPLPQLLAWARREAAAAG
jgi:thioredoxin 2